MIGEILNGYYKREYESWEENKGEELQNDAINGKIMSFLS